jgi:hypothetical protein
MTSVFHLFLTSTTTFIHSLTAKCRSTEGKKPKKRIEKWPEEMEEN